MFITTKKVTPKPNSTTPLNTRPSGKDSAGICTLPNRAASVSAMPIAVGTIQIARFSQNSRRTSQA